MASDTDAKKPIAAPASRPLKTVAARVAMEGFTEEDPELHWERAPLYRVVEVVREADGRLRKEGKIWHTDLDHLRRFGRAMASNAAASHKILIADSHGDVIEELPVVPFDKRRSAWGDWQDMPLPPRPPVKRNPTLRRSAPVARPLPVLAEPPVEADTVSPVVTDASATPLVDETVVLDAHKVPIEVVLP